MNAAPSTAPALAGAQAIAQAYAAADAAAAFRAIDAYAHASLAHALCTINRYDAGAMRVVRLYSSNPEAYPPGGSKDKAGTAWGRQRPAGKRRSLIGEGEDAIREFF